MIIREITLQTGHLEEIVNFYSGILGLKVINADNTGAVFKTQLTNLKFNFAEDQKPFYHFAFNIPQNKFDEAHEWMKGKTDLTEFDGSTKVNFKSWNAHSFYFTDPAGNIVEFIARHNLKNDSETEFSGFDIISVSEMGFPVKNVKSFFDIINKNFGIPEFSGNMKSFEAAGDDDGLFIIVPENRQWFPDYLPAEIHPIEIKIEGKLNKELDLKDYFDFSLPYKIISEV